MSRQRVRELDIPLWARNRALHYLAGSYKLSDELRHQLTQVVHGYIGNCDEERRAAAQGLDARAIWGWREPAESR